MKRTFSLSLLASLLMTSVASAGMLSSIESALHKNYPAALSHEGLITASAPPDQRKLRGFVVVLQEGIPAERARFFVSWDDYDYREVTLKKGRLKTRRGAVYTHLHKGDIMAVVGHAKVGKTVALKLISPDIYVPLERAHEERFSRVTTRFGIRFPRSVFKEENADAVTEAFGEWLAPFSSFEAAQKFSKTITSEKPEAQKLKELRREREKAQEQLEEAQQKLRKAEEEMENIQRNSTP